MNTFVVPDLHGRSYLALGLLRKAGVIPPGEVLRRTRPPHGPTVVQLGDLANCVADDRNADLEILHHAPDWFDVLLVGNHEHPYFRGPRFSGFDHDADVEAAIEALTWRAAYAVGDTLVTHAGLVDDGLVVGPAPAVADALNALWDENPRDDVFSRVGRARGGLDLYGGILWSDATEPRALSAFDQVHGHTVVSSGPITRRTRAGRWVMNLDCGGHHDVRRIAGAWLDDAGQITDGPDGRGGLVIYEYEED